MTTTVTMPAELRKRFTRNQLIATVVLMAGALIVGPMLFLILKGLLGILALAVAGSVGMAIFGFTPVLAMKYANWRLKSIKQEAMKNPIETLQNVLSEKRFALHDFAQSISDFNAQVKNYESEIEQFKRQYPEEAQKFEDQLSTMKRLLLSRTDKYKLADHQVNAFEQEIRKANAIWNMSQSAIRMNEAAGLQTEDVFEKIKAETAVDAVQTSMNKAFAQLEMALVEEEMDKPLQLPNKQPNVIEALPIKETQYTR